MVNTCVRTEQRKDRWDKVQQNVRNRKSNLQNVTKEEHIKFQSEY